MLVNVIIKEDANGSNLKAEIRKDETGDYSVKYYTNGSLNKITRYPLKELNEVEAQIQDWFDTVQNLNG